jgi:hypothetical protein
MSVGAFVVTGIALRDEYLIATNTGATSDPSSNAGNGTEWATLLVAFNETTVAAAVIPDVTMGRFG